MRFIPLAEGLGAVGETVPPTFEALKETEVGLDTELLELGEGLFGTTAGQVRLNSGVVLSWEPTMPKLGFGAVG